VTLHSKAVTLHSKAVTLLSKAVTLLSDAVTLRLSAQLASAEALRPRRDVALSTGAAARVTRADDIRVTVECCWSDAALERCDAPLERCDAALERRDPPAVRSVSIRRGAEAEA